MLKKRTKILLLLLTLLVVVAMLGMVACTNKTPIEDDPDDSGPTNPPVVMNPSQHMNKINSGLVNADEYLNTITDYSVSSEYTIYTSVENYTLTYKAVYKENKQDNLYYIKLFDNGNHVDRANIYYDGKNLYVTSIELHYMIENFSSLLLFDVFSEAVRYLDLRDFVYGETMKTYFAEGSMLTNAFSVNDFSYNKVSETRENLSIKNGDLSSSALLGIINSFIVGMIEGIDTRFDSVSLHYLGFKLSKFFEYRFSSINIEEIKFLIGDGRVDSTEVRIGGRMQGNSKFFISANYAYDITTKVISDATGIAKKYDYDGLNLGQGTYDGKVIFPTLRETDFDVSLDYDLNAQDNTKNRFTFRIYDQQDTSATKNKYGNIKEFISCYYVDETLYLNLEGFCDYVGNGVDLSALHLPKVFVKDINLKSLMELFYSNLIRAVKVLIDGDYREETPKNAHLYETLLKAIESNDANDEISFTVTEELIKEIRNDDTDTSVLLGRLLGFDDETIAQYLGENFFQLMKIIFTYNFKTEIISADVIYDDETVALFQMKGEDYFGIVLPADLNELNYTKLIQPEVITLEYNALINPYGVRDIDMSKFFGAFIGDISGKNLECLISTGEYLFIAGKVSEYDVVNAQGEKNLTTAVDLKFYRRTGMGTTNVNDELIMSLCTNPSNVNEFLVGLYIDIGDYENENGLFYTIDRATVGDGLDGLVEGDSIFNSESNLGMFFSLYQTIGENTKAYKENGYYCISMMATEGKDPVYEIIGVKDTHAIVKVKIGFDKIDLSGVNTSVYEEPYVNGLTDVSAKSIYSTGSKWQQTTAVYINGKTVNMNVNYDEETIKIATGILEYHPTAHLFGKEISYVLHIIEEKGTYVISSLNLEKELLVIDPAFTKNLPSEITVFYDNYESGTMECVIEGFYENNIKKSGYNMALLDGDFSDKNMKYTLHIGVDSIAEIEFGVYIAVINRDVIPIKEFDGKGGVKDCYTTIDGVQMPIVKKIGIDPYTYAMTKYLDSSYDIIQDIISSQETRVNFDNVYGQEEKEDETTKIKYFVDLTYDVQGYNWMYLRDLDLEWTFDTTEINYRGDIAYAYAYYGNRDDGYAVPLAIEINVMSKTVDHIQIDEEDPGVYTIDYLIKATYSIPTGTNQQHIVKVVFTDGTSRIVSLTRSSALSAEEYCQNYIYGQLSWEGTSDLEKKITEEGTTALFGSGTDRTTVKFGSEITPSNTQDVSLQVIVPSRFQSGGDMQSKYLITSQTVTDDGSGNYTINTTSGNVNLSKAKFTESSDVYAPYEINPYDGTARLPETIWLYVNKTRGTSPTSIDKEYKINWLTTDKEGQETNIIKEVDGKYVLAYPSAEEAYLVVYGKVGDGNGSIWITMHVRNLRSNIKSKVLYTPDGNEFSLTTSVSIDPYLSYLSKLPNAFVATLGSGEKVDNYDADGNPTGIDWYVVISETEKYPIKRNENYTASRYNGYYNEDGYYIFPKTGGVYTLQMVVPGGLDNTIEIGVSVSVRTLMVASEYNEAENKYNLISNYIDVYDRNCVDGDTYAGTASGGYISVNYYKAESQTLLARLIALLDNGGFGYSGFTCVETGENTLYAKGVQWDTVMLEKAINALKTPQGMYSFKINGVIDAGTINEQNVLLKITLYEQTLFEVGLTKADALVNDGVYSIKNDADKNNKLAIESELNKLTITGYYTGTQYDKYFGTTEGYSNNDYDYVMFFNVDESYKFSLASSKVYVSPYAYFLSLFDGISLIFESGMTNVAQADVSLGGKTADYFNSSVLGLNENTIVSDATSSYSYSYLILNKLSQGSAINKVLVIIVAEVATRQTTQTTENVDTFNDDLTEMYPNGYDLPAFIEVVYKTAQNNSYTVKYSVGEWLAASGSMETFGSAPLTVIDKKHIDIIDGKAYQFMYTLPDSNAVYYLFVNFNKKNIDGVNYAAAGYISMYDITNGEITIDNAYLFLTKTGQSKYTFDTTLIPTTIDVYTNTGKYISGKSDSYEVNWTFDKTEFDEGVFATGATRELLAHYTINSYYHNGSAYTQTINVYVNIAPLVFYGIQYDGLTILPSGDVGTNEVYNVIQIDPYNDVNGYNGNFKLPTSIKVRFNSGTQSYTFNNVTYRLLDSEGISEKRSISEIEYDESGHKITQNYITNRNQAILHMIVDGFPSGITVYVNFLQRLINSVRLTNYMYDDTGAFVYEKMNNGAIIYNKTEPVRSTYYAFADYTFSDEEDARVAGQMPVLYVDPYNTATFDLPTKATIEFAADRGKYSSYNIGGWQVYNYSTGMYENFATPNNNAAATDKNFYQINRNGVNYGYYNLTANDYQGKQYIIRGYISVGMSQQYFEVAVVVLNRSLRTSVVLGDTYSVNYDFNDPISAMLSDIPSILGAQMFVDYDNYYKSFKVSGLHGGRTGNFALTIGDAYLYSQCDNEGHKRNNAVIPSILWENSYDTNGDGEPDIEFDDFTTTGYKGKINGNVYYSAGNLTALIEYYTRAVNGAYGELVKALMWDNFFIDGVVSGIYSTTAKNAIDAAAVKLNERTIYETYAIALNGLSQQYQDYFGKDLITITVQEMNREAMLVGKIYDFANEDDKPVIINTLYNSLKETYDAWVAEGSLENGKTSKIEIFINWLDIINVFTSVNVTTSSQLGAYQKLKAAYYDEVTSVSGNFTNDEITRMNKSYGIFKANLYNYINADIWNNVFTQANIYERTVMDKVLRTSTITGNDALSKSVALDKLKAELSNYEELGAVGEEAFAEINIPVIDYNAIITSKVDSTPITVISFNKFNFESIGSEYVIQFKLSYKDIYKEEIKDATDDATEEYRDSEAQTSLEKYAEEYLKAAINEIAPKERNEVTGEYETISGMYAKGEAFGYEWLKKYGDSVIYGGNNTAQESYGSLWDALYSYTVNKAIIYVVQNIEGLSSYETLSSMPNVSEDEWTAVVNTLKAVAEMDTTSVYNRNVYNKAVEYKLQPNKKTATINLIDYILKNNKEVRALDAYVDKVTAVQYADLATKLLTASYSTSTAIGKAMNEYGSGQMETGAGKMFNYSYSKIGVDGNEFDLVGVMYEMLQKKFYDATQQPEPYSNAAYKTLCSTYNSIMYPMEYKGIVCFKALISGDTELKDQAKKFFDYLLQFIVSDVSPYDLLMQNSTSLSMAIKSVYLEDDDADCLLNHVVIPESTLTVLYSVVGLLGVDRSEAELRYKRYVLYSVLKDKCYSNTKDKVLFDQWEKDALSATRSDAIADLFAQLKQNANGVYNYLVSSFGQKATERLAFAALLDEKYQEGLFIENLYKGYIGNYCEANVYTQSKEILNNLSNACPTNGVVGNMTNAQYILKYFYGPHIEEKKFTEIETTSDDNYNVALLTETARELCNKYGASGVNAVCNGYGKDYLLQAYVYYYNNIATLDQKQIIAEVMGMYTGTAVVGTAINDFNIERAIVLYISDTGTTGLGKALFNDLSIRYDMGASYKTDINNCFFYVYLQNVLNAVQYDIANIDVSVDGNYSTSVNDYNEIISMLAEEPSDYTDLVAYIARDTVRRNMWNVAIGPDGSLYGSNYKNAIAALNNDAYNYTYYQIYNKTDSNGEYEHKDKLDDILEMIVNENVTNSFYERVFQLLEQTLINGKLNILYNATEIAVETLLYCDLYDKYKLLGMTADEFVLKMMKFITGSNGIAEELFGENLDGVGGIIGTLTAAIKSGNLTEDMERQLDKLNKWWKTDEAETTVYGQLSDLEQELLEEIYLQSYYQTNVVGINESTRSNLATLGMITSIYLFLGDLENYIDEKMPDDYFSANNVEEYKHYVIYSLLNSDVMKQSGHSLSLAQATVLKNAKERVEAIAKEFVAMTSGRTALSGNETTVEDYVKLISKALTEDNCIAIGEGKEEKEALYARYLAKAMEYVGYTSASSDEDFNAQENNPLYSYVNKVYQSVTGYAIGASVATGNENDGEFGRLSTNYFADNTTNYLDALNAMLEDRLVNETFYSQDAYDKNSEEQSRHVLYFNRTTWDEFLNSGATDIAPVTVNNSSIYLANSKKTNKVNDVAGYHYENSFSASNISFTLADLTYISVKFDGETEYNNTLSIDAIAPQLPSSAYALGYIVTGSGTVVVDLGRIAITEYSASFNELIYESKTISNDDAYSITLKAFNNTVMNVVLKVKYLDRSIKEVYVNSENYVESPALIVDPANPFVDMYSIYNQEKNTNVIYLNPTNPDILNSANNGYVLPETLAIAYGNGDNALFRNVKWNLGKVGYSIAGTDGKYVGIKLASYEYDDADGNTRSIEYDYVNYSVNMKIYNGTTGVFIKEETYQLSATTMINWNMSIYVENLTVRTVQYHNGNEYVELGTYNTKINYIDATSTYSINPYYAEYPSKVKITFNNGGYEELELKPSDWALEATNSLANIISEVANEKEFNAYFKYLGYRVAMRFMAMNIMLPKVDPVEPVYINGGTLYLLHNQSSARAQLNEYYSYMYYNFGQNDVANWQKVPLAFDNADVSSISISKTETYHNIRATLGATRMGIIDKNIEFDIKVVDLNMFATINGNINNYVTYDYYSVPGDSSNNKKKTADEPNVMGDYYTLLDENGNVNFTINRDTIAYDFITHDVSIDLTYELTTEVDGNLGFDEEGRRVRKMTIKMPMNSYLYTNVTAPVFNTDATDKKWKWTDIPKTNVAYVDALYWTLGQSLKASDLPTATDSVTGEEVHLMWDLNELNVNKANEDGYVVYGYYLTANNTWSSLPLIIYIEKIDVTNALINAVNGADGRYINKEYDGKFFELTFDSSLLRYLREDGTTQALTEEDYRIEYLVESEGGNVWKEGEYPINAGVYYIRIVFTDYNVFIDAGDEEWLFRLTIAQYVVNVSKITFKGERNNSVQFVYSGIGKYLEVESGIPTMPVDRWFGVGEKELLVNGYIAMGYSETEAKAKAYMDIYNRISENAKAQLVKWYDMTKASGNFSTDSEIKAYVYTTYMVYNLEITEISAVITYKYNNTQVSAPTGVGTYTAIITINDPNGNYVANGQKAINLIIDKDSTISYYIINPALTYSGGVQNPEINGLHKNGSIPNGVTVTYTYTYGENTLVVINDSNNISIDSGNTTPGITTRGIKNVGSYECHVVIDGGENYIDGEFNTAIMIKKASVYIEIDDITQIYLKEVVDLSGYVRIYSDDNPSGSNTYLRGGDRLSDLGNLVVDTEVKDYYPRGTYFTYIRGLKLAADGNKLFTELEEQVSRNGITYRLMSLSDGMANNPDDTFSYENILNYTTNDGNSYVYNDIITLFGNYYVYVKMHKYSPEEDEASGKYTITSEDGALGFNNDNELQNFINGVSPYTYDPDNDVTTDNNVSIWMRDGASIIIYLEALTDLIGAYVPYSAITINYDVDLTIVGCKDTTTAEISTLLSGITVNKGTVTLKIMHLTADTSGATGITLNDKAGTIKLYDSIISGTSNAQSTTGIRTSVNYSGRVFTENVKFTTLNRAIELFSGEMEINSSEFVDNYYGIVIDSSSTSLRIMDTQFKGHEIAVKSETKTVTILYNTFEYNRISIELPEVLSADMRINNKFNYNGTTIKETDLSINK